MHGAERTGFHHVWVRLREWLTHWVVAGLILSLTGFVPEEWFARFIETLALPERVRTLWPAGLDPRVVIFALGVAIIVGSVLVRQLRRRSHPASIPGKPEVASPELALPDKPSIAVLPFQNLSGDPEQDYFCDGMVEDITSALSRMKWLFVIARNSSFTYKGKAIDAKQVGRELGVRYILEGSVRKAANRVRIAGQLIDASSAALIIWADRFEGALEDVFDLQDRVTSSVVGAIEPAITTAEIHRAHLKPTEALDAYDYFLRALAQSYTYTPVGWDEALALCRKAIAIDPYFASAYGLAAFCRASQINTGPKITDLAGKRAEGTEFAKKAIDHGADDPFALSRGGISLIHLARDYGRGTAAVDRSLSLDANNAYAWIVRGYIRWWNGEGDRAIEHYERAMRLSPRDPNAAGAIGGIGWAHFVEGRYEEAIKSADESLSLQPGYITSLRCKIASLALLGRINEAKSALAKLLLTQTPDATVVLLREFMPMRRPDDMARYLDGLRKAGLPEN